MSNRDALLDTLARSEGTATSPVTQNMGYDIIVTGEDGAPERFDDYSRHPFEGGRAAKVINSARGLDSTASGRYQEILHQWLAYKHLLSLPDFSPASQDAAALQQIKECGGLVLIDAGRFDETIAAISHLWASLAGANYPGQNMRSMGWLRLQYTNAGGTIA